ncbi:MAG: alpha/beta fold hydrolase [Nocardioidaceae bacterium]
MQPTPEKLSHLSNGIELCYDTFGDPGDPALLLIMGLAGPLNWWDAALCSELAERGYFVIRYDNRDVGRSTRQPGRKGGRIDVVKTFVLGPRSQPPYVISDLATDAVGLLDHLDIGQAHVTGVSMGGMIAQTVAIEHPDRVLSLVSMMSTTGRRTVGWQDPRLFPRLLAPAHKTREGYIDQELRTWKLIGSPGYRSSEQEVRARASETYDRGINRAGVMRQMQAILAQPDRTAPLRDLTVPTLVVHGLADRLVHVSGGRATAHAVPGAELVLVPGLAHDLPADLWPVFVDGIDRTAQRARAAHP